MTAALLREYQDLADRALEARIKQALDDCHAAKAAGNQEEANRKWELFVSLVASRSPGRVRKMERDRGLR